ncbi:MAG: hypothetical protein JJT78_18300 [Leptospira sp.]|nr:hypothetical protein [Leptospira sp.]
MFIHNVYKPCENKINNLLDEDLNYFRYSYIMKPIVSIFVFILVSFHVYSQTLEDVTSSISQEISKLDIHETGSNILVLPLEVVGFPDEVQGLYVSDKITSYLVQFKKFNVVEREQVSQIFNEQKLSMYGLIEGEAAKKIGNLMSVNIIVSGRIYRTDRGGEISIRAIHTENGKILHATTKPFDFKSDTLTPQSYGGLTGSWKVTKNAPYLNENNTIYKKIILRKDGEFSLYMKNNNGSDVEIQGKYEIDGNNINYYSSRMIIDGRLTPYKKLTNRLEGTIYLVNGKLYFNYTSMGQKIRTRLDSMNPKFRCEAERIK